MPSVGEPHTVCKNFLLKAYLGILERFPLPLAELVVEPWRQEKMTKRQKKEVNCDVMGKSAEDTIRRPHTCRDARVSLIGTGLLGSSPRYTGSLEKELASECTRVQLSRSTKQIRRHICQNYTVHIFISNHDFIDWKGVRDGTLWHTTPAFSASYRNARQRLTLDPIQEFQSTLVLHTPSRKISRELQMLSLILSYRYKIWSIK